MARTTAVIENDLVNLLKSHRLSKQLTLEGMAEQFGVSCETYRAWEQGRMSPRLSRAKTMAATLGISINDMIRFIEPSYRPPKQ